ncbi:hypothetical protein LTR08_004136 [Meristemomyces frigidus]|nr:hypothetical protein LTR08_004136 [Meristemomyces frigidus]
MSSTNIQLAWAMPVCPVRLAAHASAHIELQPVIDTLRLCHRFGTTELAGFTALPVELIVLVEEHLIDQERRRQRKIFGAAYKCWTSQCQPIDHLDVGRLEEKYGTCREYLKEELTELNANVLESFPVFGSRSSGFEDLRSEYDNDHNNSIAAWHECVGKGGHMVGELGRQADLFLRQYGLQIWTSQMQIDVGGYEARLIKHATLCYLKLPTPARAEVSYETGVDSLSKNWLDGYETPYAGANGSALLVVMPPKLSAKSLTRFSRMVELLDLEILANSKRILATAEGDTEAEEDPAVYVDEKPDEELWPRLMLLTRNILEEPL